MLGKVIDMNATDAFVSFDDGTTKNVGISYLPQGTRVGDKVNMDPVLPRLNNSKLVDFF